MADLLPPNFRRGRGSQSNNSGRYETLTRDWFDDGWSTLEEIDTLRNSVRLEQAKNIISTNKSPDISFDQSINPYRGCEHGCIYCYARPTHAYLGLSPGLDFESKLVAKPNAPERLRCQLAAPNYHPKTIALGTNTDPYQPIERQFGITRQLLEIMEETNHPVVIVTKSSLVLRDLDILERLASRGLVKVAISITSLNHKLSRKMEPRASTPKKRVVALRKLEQRGIPTAVMVAPIIPALNEFEIENILTRVANQGTREAGYVILRLPLEVKDLFHEWLTAEFPNRAKRVLSLVYNMRDGKAYKSEWGERMRGRGPYADQIARRFEMAMKRLNMNNRQLPLRTDLFRPQERSGQQLPLL